MKLIYCPKCKDVFSLRHERRDCSCGASWGWLINFISASYGGRAVPLGVVHSSFNDAVQNQPEDGNGKRFEAFVIPKSCHLFEKES